MQRSLRHAASALLAAFTMMVATIVPVVAQTVENRLAAAFERGELAGLHAVVVEVAGERVLEAYFPGADERWGSPLGERSHGPDTLHDLRSVTKSVVGLLYGIALEEGAVPAPEASLLSQFPQYADLAGDKRRDAMTIDHALTMQLGTRWNESLPYSDPNNSETAMEAAEDRYRFVLDRPMASDPGTQWSYNGGAVALLAKLIENGTKMPIDRYAQLRLFEPLGIGDFEWVRGADGVPSAASGLRLSARNLTGLGAMIANDGMYEGRQIVPKAWLARSFAPAVEIQPGFSYGYLWYLGEAPNANRIVIAQGNGGQRLTVQPKVGFVAATLAGNYNMADDWKLSLKVLLDYAIPAAQERRSR